MKWIEVLEKLISFLEPYPQWPKAVISMVGSSERSRRCGTVVFQDAALSAIPSRGHHFCLSELHPGRTRNLLREARTDDGVGALLPLENDRQLTACRTVSMALRCLG
jgi:hypothetical protein